MASIQPLQGAKTGFATRDILAQLLHQAEGVDRQVAAVASGLDALEVHGAPGNAEALQRIALAMLSVEAFELAELVAARAVDSAEFQPGRLREANARMILGEVQRVRGRQLAARRHFRLAARHYRMLEEPARLKAAMAAIADTHRREGNQALAAGHGDEARGHWERAMRSYVLALSTGKGEAEDATALAALAECQCRLGRLGGACDYAGEAAGRASALGDAQVLATAHLWESHALRSGGDLEGAERACRLAVAAAERLASSERLIECLDALAALLDVQGRFEAGAEAQARAMGLRIERDSLLTLARDQLTSMWQRRGGARAPMLRINCRA